MTVGAMTGVWGKWRRRRSRGDAAELSLEYSKLEEHPTGMGTREDFLGTEASELGLNGVNLVD